MPKVCVLQVNSYEEELVYAAVKKGIELLGGPDAFLSREEKILLKPNLLSGAAPEKAVTTHPSVFGAVARCLREAGFSDLRYGDGPGIGASDPKKVLAVTGIEAAAEKYDLTRADFDSSVTVDFPDGRTAKKFHLAKGVCEADAIVSICKMKTHALETLTGALKNQYGCVATLSKGAGHAKYPNRNAFADMIVDLNRLLRPRLFVMDGIVAMEGNGPGSGDPVAMNVILMSADPVALDTVFAELVYVEPAAVPTTLSAYRAGFGTMVPGEIEILTFDGPVTLQEAKKRFGNPGFNVKRNSAGLFRAGAAASKLLRKLERPVVDPAKCVACGICEKSCPVEGKAVRSGNGQKAKYDYSRCIRCYCCQEMCPAKAIRKKVF